MEDDAAVLVFRDFSVASACESVSDPASADGTLASLPESAASEAETDAAEADAVEADAAEVDAALLGVLRTCSCILLLFALRFHCALAGLILILPARLAAALASGEATSASGSLSATADSVLCALDCESLCARVSAL